MFVETALVLFTVGFVAGLGFALVVAVWPLERKLNHVHRQQMRDMRQRAYRAEIRRKHLGTPYIRPPVSEVERLLADISGVVDDHSGSRKAPGLRSVS